MNKYHGLTLAFVIVIVGICSVYYVHTRETDFVVEIEYDDFKLIDTTIVWSDSTTSPSFDIKQGYVVKVSKEDSKGFILNYPYVKEGFVENKKDIPQLVCKLKSQILKDIKEEEVISKEIEEIKNQIENTDCS